MYSVSVIMPIYNNEKTLKRAIDSMLDQKLHALELILINDGSTDSSGDICEEYVKKEPLLVEVIHQEHSGDHHAKNIGLYHSNGRFIYFADPKTIYDKNFLQDNVNLAVQKDAELVVFGFSLLISNNEEEFEHHLPRMPFLDSQENFRNHFRNFYHFYPYVTFNKLYRKEFIVKNRIKFQSMPGTGDAFFNLDLYKELGSVAFNRKSYFYRQSRNFSLTISYSEKKFVQSIKFVEKLEETISHWGYTNEFKDIVAEEYYKACYSEFVNLSKEKTSFSQKHKEEKILSIIQNNKFQQSFEQIKHQAIDLPLHKELTSLIQKKNIKGITNLFSKTPDSKRKTSIKTFLLKSFKL